MDDKPAEVSPQNELQPREAGVVEARQVKLSPEPPPYQPPPRDEPGPEAYPPAAIYGDFIPIEDAGPETPVPLALQPRDEQDAHDAQDESGPDADLPPALSGDEKP